MGAVFASWKLREDNWGLAEYRRSTARTSGTAVRATKNGRRFKSSSSDWSWYQGAIGMPLSENGWDTWCKTGGVRLYTYRDAMNTPQMNCQWSPSTSYYTTPMKDPSQMHLDVVYRTAYNTLALLLITQPRTLTSRKKRWDMQCMGSIKSRTGSA